MDRLLPPAHDCFRGAVRERFFPGTLRPAFPFPRAASCRPQFPPPRGRDCSPPGQPETAPPRPPSRKPPHGCVPLFRREVPRLRAQAFAPARCVPVSSPFHLEGGPGSGWKRYPLSGSGSSGRRLKSTLLRRPSPADTGTRCTGVMHSSGRPPAQSSLGFAGSGRSRNSRCSGSVPGARTSPDSRTQRIRPGGAGGRRRKARR